MQVRLLADDLTGALDTAAQFVGSAGTISVYLSDRMPQRLPPNAAIDSGTRELGAGDAAAAVAHLAAVLAPLAGTIAYLKLDSLLRGTHASEIATCLAAFPSRRCIIAPAFPFQGRVTRDGLQYVRSGSEWQRAGPSLQASLHEEGVLVRLCRPGDPVPDGVSLWDADSDKDLHRVAEAGLALDAPVLWCGSGGLAGVLAPSPPPPAAPPHRPQIGLFGSDHTVTSEQLRRCGEHLLRLPHGGPDSAGRVAESLARRGVAFCILDLPSGLERSVAAARIAQEFGRLAARLPAPHSLVVAGGETLRALCVSLGVASLDVCGQIAPGIPRSVMRGGRWDGVDVISKSGAFGRPELLHEIAASSAAPSLHERHA